MHLRQSTLTAIATGLAAAVAAGSTDVDVSILREAHLIKSSPPPSAVIPMIDPGTDTAGDAKAWTRAVRIEVARSLSGWPVNEPASVLALHDGVSLRLKLKAPAERTGLVEDGGFGGDHWEFFFAAGRSKPYRQLGISATGAVATCAVGEGADWGPWEVTPDVRQSPGEPGWTVMVTLPLSSLSEKAPAPGEMFFLNIIRVRAGSAEPSFWSPIFQGGFHCPARFASVTLAANTDEAASVSWPLVGNPPRPTISWDCDDIDAPVKLLFPGGRPRAVTASFDDGRVYDRKLVDIFNSNGIRGTFNVPVDAEVGTNGISTIYKGHEVAVHDMGDFGAAARRLGELVGYPVRGLAYVGGACDPAMAASLAGYGISYGRTIGTARWFNLSTNFTTWGTTCHQNESVKYARTLLSFPGRPAILSIWGHSYEFGDSGDWSGIESFCRLVGGRADIWYATNIEIHDYLASAARLTVIEDANAVRNDSDSSIWLEIGGKPVELKPGATCGL